jgi:solute carrier family 25 (mitochondrial adenine nucleotide translocator), member 4/5/6/31
MLTDKKDEDSKLLDFAKNLMYGGISGSFTKTIVAPLERIKIVLQVQDSSKQVFKIINSL